MFAWKPIHPLFRWGLTILCLGVFGISTGCASKHKIGRPKVEYTVLANKNHPDYRAPSMQKSRKRIRRIMLRNVRKKGHDLMMYVRPEPRRPEQYVRAGRDGVSVSENKRRRNSVASDY